MSALAIVVLCYNVAGTGIDWTRYVLSFFGQKQRLGHIPTMQSSPVSSISRRPTDVRGGRTVLHPVVVDVDIRTIEIKASNRNQPSTAVIDVCV